MDHIFTNDKETIAYCMGYIEGMKYLFSELQEPQRKRHGHKVTQEDIDKLFRKNEAIFVGKE